MDKEIIDIFADDCLPDLDSRQYDEMSRLYNMITGSSDENLALQFLKNDPTFVACFGTEDPKGQLISRMEESNEHLLQDFLRWPLGGWITGPWLARLSRIRSICSTARVKINEEKFDAWYARSIYLPPEQNMRVLMDGLDKLCEGIESCMKDPKFDLGKLVVALNKCGINASPDGSVKKIITTDWKAVAGDWVGSLLLAALGASIGGGFGALFTGISAISGAAAGGVVAPLIGTAATQVGRVAPGVIGAHMASSNGECLADKGYTKNSLATYAERMVKLIDNVYKFEKIDPAKHIDKEKATDLPAKIRFVKKAVDILIHTIKNVGRGLAAAIGHVS